MRDADVLRMIAAAAASWMWAEEWAMQTMRFRRGTQKLPNKIIRSIL
jgi:hypothetical protein